MKRNVSKPAILVLFPLFALFVSMVFAAEPQTEPAGLPPIEKILPEKTVFLATIPDFPGAVESIKETGIYGLITQAEMSQALRPVLDLLEARWNKASDRVKEVSSYTLSNLIDHLAGQLSLAVVDFDPDNDKNNDVVIALDVKSTMIGRELLSRAEAILADKSGGNVQANPYEIDGIAVARVTLGDTDVFYGCLGKTLVACTKEPTLEYMIKSMQGIASGKPLAENAVYKGSSGRIDGSDALLSVYMNIECFLETMADELAADPEFHAMFELMGFNAVKGATYHLNIENRVFVDRLHIYSPGERRGLLKMLTLPANQLKTAARVPRRAVYYLGMPVDAKLWFNTFKDVLQKADPGGHEEFSGVLSQIKAQGFDIEQELLPALGKELCVFAAFPKGMLTVPIPDIGFMLELSKPEEFEALIARLLLKVGNNIPLTTADYKGVTIRAIEAGKELGGMMPSFAVSNGYVLLASSPQVLKEMLDVTPEKSLGTSPRFIDWRKRVEEGGCVFATVDTAVIAMGVYDLLIQQVQKLVRRKKVDIKTAALPTRETLARFLEPFVATVKSDSNGFLFQSAAPVPVIGNLGPFVGVIAAVAAAAQGQKAEEKIEASAKVDSSVNFGKIYFAAELYAEDNNELYPSSLKGNTAMFQHLMDKGYLDDPWTLIAPGGKEQVATKTGAHCILGDGNVSYEFAALQLSRASGGEPILCYEKAAYSPDGRRAVLYADGRVRILTDADFRKSLEKQSKGNK
ncbi:MAG: DUF3352 domain-containing protein [Planctomycetota bacterium]|jgi:hypothetical protein